jgi:hypothetical protein
MDASSLPHGMDHDGRLAHAQRCAVAASSPSMNQQFHLTIVTEDFCIQHTVQRRPSQGRFNVVSMYVYPDLSAR